MPDLTVNFAGINFKNPFVLASAPPAMDAEHIIRASKLGWAGAVTKTIGFKPVSDLRPRLAELRFDKKVIAMENIELISVKSADEWCEKDIPEIKARAPADFVLIASIMAPPEPEKWRELAKRVEEAGADMIELNVSCPHGMPEKRMGMFIGQDPNLTRAIVKGAKKDAKIPVMVKLTPSVTDIAPIVKAAVDGGIDAFSAVNTMPSIIGIDLEQETPIPEVGGKSTVGGLSGPAIKPIALRCISEIRKVSTFPIAGIGGITDWQACIEFILIGASTLQLCTAVMWKGYKIIDELKKGVLKYMKKKNYKSITDFCGNALKNIVSHSNLKLTAIHAEVIPEKCTGCKKCVTACQDGGFHAITIRNRVASINKKICNGCGLCKIVCNFDAIHFVSS